MTAVPTVQVEVGFAQTANTGAWTLGTSDLGTGTVLGQPLIYTYTDVGADVRELKVHRGKARELDQYQAGSVNVRLNNRERDYDPLNLSGPYVSGGVTDVRPGRPVRINFVHPISGVAHRVFTGRVREWTIDYTGQFDSVSTLAATDPLTELAGVPVDLTTTADDTGEAARQVFVDAGFTSFVVSEGLTNVQATAFSDKALAALRSLEFVEQGALYAEADGDVYFASRGNLIVESRSRNSQATFGSGDLTFEDIDIAYESNMIVNSVTATRTGGTAQTATNADSIDAVGTKAKSYTGLPSATDADALALATHLVGKFGEPHVRIRSISFTANKNADLMTQALSRRLRDRITVTFAPVGGGSAISQEVFIVGIEHDIRPALMRTTFRFEPTEWSFGWVLGMDALGSVTLGF